MISDGILVLNKPGNWTSHDCVAICRRVLRLKGIKKIGHGGTLDPMAEGVLPIFIGQATRIMEYLELDHKKYICELQLGVTTDTQDIWGEVLSRDDWSGITEEEVLRQIEGFRGIIEQMPPVYSAVRIDGRHLYDYARKGRSGREEMIPQEVLDRVKTRQVYIPHLEVLEINMAAGRVRFEVECSKGTYIRTICSDLGARLGCGAAMTALKRTAIGSIGLEKSVSPEQIKAMDPKAGETWMKKPDGEKPAGQPVRKMPAVRLLEEMLLPTDAALTHFGRAVMPADRAHYFRQGNSIRLHQIRFEAQPNVSKDPLTGEIPCNARGRRYDRIYRVYQKEDGLFLGTGFKDVESRVLKADKVFQALNEPKNK